MEDLSQFQIVGAWVSIFLTLSVLSFLYDDNPIYKIAEHLYMGIAIGYGVVEAYFNLLKPNLFDKIGDGQAIYLLPLILSIMLMFKISRKFSWVARVPIAILVSAYAAVKITGEASGKLIAQIENSFPNFVTSYTEHGFWSWENDGAGLFSDAFLVLALSACLLHFYFSEIPARAQRFGVGLSSACFALVFILTFLFTPLETAGAKALVGAALGLCAGAPFLMLSPYRHYLTRFGVIVLMISFGASFGFTVMGRISLAIGRGQELLGQNISAEKAAQIQPQLASAVSLALIILFLAVWKNSKNKTEAS